MSKEIKQKKQTNLPKDHWKNAKRIWNLPINLGTRNTNQVDKDLSAKMFKVSHND